MKFLDDTMHLMDFSANVLASDKKFIELFCNYGIFNKSVLEKLYQRSYTNCLLPMLQISRIQ